jgi:hypothetical protein
MPSVARTKRAKRVMISGRCSLASLAASSAARTVYPGLDGLGLGVELRGGVPRVPPGDEERGDELGDAEDEGDVDVAEELGAHEAAGVVRQQHVQQVPGDERDRQREGEGAEGAAQFGELSALLHFGELLG